MSRKNGVRELGASLRSALWGKAEVLFDGPNGDPKRTSAANAAPSMKDHLNAVLRTRIPKFCLRADRPVHELTSWPNRYSLNVASMGQEVRTPGLTGHKVSGDPASLPSVNREPLSPLRA